MSNFIGVDIIEIERFEQAIARWGERLLQRIFTEQELKIYRLKPASLAARFAAKEAVFKALSPPKSMTIWKEIEILTDSNGKPEVHLYGTLKQKALILKLEGIAVSLSHSKQYAIAFASGTTK